MKLGYRVLGAGALFVGVVGLVFDDFALVWQPVPPDVPHRALLAYIVAALFVLAGAAVNWRRTAALGAAMIAILQALDVLLLHGPRIIAHPDHFPPWSGAAEQLGITMGGIIAFTMVANMNAGVGERVARAARIVFGICAVEYGIVHFHYPVDTASFIPKWIPPGPMFWAYATGAAQVAAGLAFISGVQARLAGILLTVLYVLFSVFVHARLLATDPTSHMFWTMNAINILFVGTAWTIADSLGGKSMRSIAHE
jgi:uncharacterized membrane protein YphA (DoxX/SURF4 family)